MVLMFTILMIIPMLLIAVNFLISKKEFIEREKPSPFECGFDPISSARLPFSTQFFLIAVVFLIFDVEITLILPIAYSSLPMNALPLMFIFSVFILILIAGLLLEWKQGALEWLR